jgi:hypothetical protein
VSANVSRRNLLEMAATGGAALAVAATAAKPAHKTSRPEAGQSVAVGKAIMTFWI